MSNQRFFFQQCFEFHFVFEDIHFTSQKGTSDLRSLYQLFPQHAERHTKSRQYLFSQCNYPMFARM